MKKLLIISPYFAPQSHAAMFRVHKLAKFLPRIGWKPYVVTVDTNYHYNEDSALLNDLPKDVEIYRAKYVEPTLRGVRMFFGGKNRGFSAEKEMIKQQDFFAVNKTSLGASIYRKIIEKYLSTPDPYWTWYAPALRLARELMVRERIPIVYTTCLPFTCNSLGLALQKSGMKWVADFRDPPTYAAKTSSAVDSVYIKQRQIERNTYRSADAIVGLSSSYSMIFGDMFGAKNVQFIPTGVDDDLILETSKNSEFDFEYVIFAGEYLTTYGDTLFKMMAGLGGLGCNRSRDVKLVIVGNEIINRRVTSAIIEKLDISNRVIFVDHVNQKTLYRYLKGSLGVILAPGENAHWWTNFAKLVDYIGLGCPVLAIVPEISEARNELLKSKLGIFLDGPIEEKTAKFIEFIEKSPLSLQPNLNVVKKYSASEMTKSFVKIFENLSSQ